MSAEPAPSIENNVVHIRGDYPIAHPGHPDPSVIESLEFLLERAKGGEITGIIWAAHYYDGEGTSHIAGMISRSTVGHLFDVMQRANAQINET